VNDVTAERAAYEKVDVYMVWAPQDGALDGLRVDLGVDNLFDKTIETVFAGVVDPGRNFKGRISWTGSF
jgi:hemoglobin/transferrin/lactoferrin receptor protein